MAKWCTPVQETCSREYLSDGWTVTNWFLRVYELSGNTETVHTGDDINLPGGNDAGKPIVSIGDGKVIAAEFIEKGTWMGLVVIQHPIGDSFVCSRYAHLGRDILVKAGDPVTAGQPLGTIANVEEFQRTGMSPHLHFDISATGNRILLDEPGQWPKGGSIDDRKAFISQNYQNPTAFMERVLNESAESDDPEAAPPPEPTPISGEIEPRIVSADPFANVRSTPNTSSDANIVRALDNGTRIEVIKGQDVVAEAMIWLMLADGSGWVAAKLTHFVLDEPQASEETEIRVVEAGMSLNVRHAPDASSEANIVGALPDGGRVAVLKGRSHPASGFTWLPLADGSGWIAAEFTRLATISGGVSTPEPAPVVPDPTPPPAPPPAPTPVTPDPTPTPIMPAGAETEVRMVSADPFLFVRSTPDTSSPDNIVRKLPNGTRIEVIKGLRETANGFTWLRLADESGWVAENFTFIPRAITSQGIRGINIDLNVDDFSPADLSAFDYCRFVFDLSQDAGNTNFADPRIAKFDPKIRGYIQQGVTPIIVVNHEFYGEGKNFFWDTMREGTPETLQRWSELTEQFVIHLRKLVGMYGSDVVYEIWNESDAGSVAAVFVPPKAFATLLDRSLETIHAVAPDATVIAGGLVSGHASYWGETVRAMRRLNQLAGVGLHPYGRGPSGDPALFENHGKMRPLIDAYANLSSVKSFWLTEWGVLGDANFSNPPAVAEHDVAAYISRFLADNEQDPRIAASVYFAYRDHMHNGYGLARGDNSRKELVWKAIAKQPTEA